MNVHTWEREVVAALNQIDPAILETNAAHTAVVEALAEAGNELGFLTAATGGEAAGADRREWLWDCTWRKYREEEPWPLLFVPMVAECEWSRNHENMLYDFNKLQAANAPLRVFVFDGANGAEDSRARAGMLCYHVGEMSPALPDGVRFVLAGWERDACPAFRIFTVSGQGEVLREIAP